MLPYFELVEAIGGFVGLFLLGSLCLGGLIAAPFFLIYSISEYIKNPDACWSAKDTDVKTEDLLNLSDRYFDMGIDHANAGRYKEAIEVFEHIISIKPNKAKAFYNLGWCYDKLQLYEEAIAAYKETIRIAPKCVRFGFDAYTNLSIIYHTLGQKIEAINILNQAIKAAKGDISTESWLYFIIGGQYGSQGRWQESIISYKESIRISAEFKEHVYFSLAIAHHELGQHKEEMQIYKELIQIKPDDDWAYCQLGECYVEMGMLDEAMEFFKQALKKKPDSSHAHFGLGVVYGKRGCYQEEIKEYQKTIKINPEYGKAHNNLGVAYSNLGQYQEAIEAYKQAIIINHKYADAYNNLGIAYLSIGDKNSALEEYKILKSLDAEQATKLFNLIDK